MTRSQRVFLVTLAVFLVAGTALAWRRTTRIQNEARHRWGPAITGTIRSNEVAKGESYGIATISFTPFGGSPTKIQKNVHPNWKVGSQVKLWASSDGKDVFVVGSRYDRNRIWLWPNWRSSPWPTTQGTLIWIWLIMLLPAYGLARSRVWVCEEKWEPLTPWTRRWRRRYERGLERDERLRQATAASNNPASSSRLDSRPPMPPPGPPPSSPLTDPWGSSPVQVIHRTPPPGMRPGPTRY